MKVSMCSVWRTAEAGFACCSKWVSGALYFWSLTAIWRTNTVVPRNDVPKLTAFWRSDTGWTCSPHPTSRSPEVRIQPVLLDVAAAHAGGQSELGLIAATLSFHRLGSDSWFIPRQGLVPIDRPVNALTRKVFLMNCGHRNQQIKARTENKLVLGDIKKDPKCWDNFPRSLWLFSA